jgi:hypothetical protein
MYSTASMRPAAAIILRWRGVQQLGLVVTTPFMSSHDLTKSPNACLLHVFPSERSELSGAAPHSAIGGPARIGGMPGSRNRTDCRPERKNETDRYNSAFKYSAYMLLLCAICLYHANVLWTQCTSGRVIAPSRHDYVALAWRPATRFGSHYSLHVESRSHEISKCLPFARFPFREKRADRCCSAQRNRWSGAHWRNARIEESHRLSS